MTFAGQLTLNSSHAGNVVSRGLLFLSLCLLLSVSPAWSDSSRILDAAGRLDVEKIRTLYFDGDFEGLITDLEDYRKSHSDASVQDKIIWNKYLGIIYTSKPDTEKKGEAFLYQWVSHDPDPRIADLFVSQKIRDVFEQQKRDYEAVQKSRSAHPPASESETASNPPAVAKSPADTGEPGPDSKSGKNRRWIWWSAGAGVAAATAAVFLLLSGGDKDPGTSGAAEVTISWPISQ